MIDMRVGALGRTYRYHTATSPGGPPLWSFGFGLSYTNFTLGFDGTAPQSLTLSPSAPTARVSLRVANTGAVDGDEVVQAYFAPGAVVSPQPPFLPRRQLFAFERVRVPAGGSAVVDVDVAAAVLALTLADGTRGPIDGAGVIIFSRGEGVGPELMLPYTMAGF